MLVLLSEYHRSPFIFSIREIIVHGHPVVAVVGGGGVRTKVSVAFRQLSLRGIRL
jgi:hypothetical protein|tara:strand:- start:175 stop:339 length:165 start_codon:yes stop_codon:yes gene_type:complete